MADELALEHDGVHDVRRVPELDRLRRSIGVHGQAAPRSGWKASSYCREADKLVHHGEHRACAPAI